MSVKPVESKTLTVPADISVLDRVRNFVTECGQAVLDQDSLDDLVLAVDEAVANVIEHAYAERDLPGVLQELGVETAVYTDRYTVTVMDRGAPFDPASLPPVDLQAHYRAAKQDGLGVHMIRQLVDCWEYYSEPGSDQLPGWNRLTLVKYRDGGLSIDLPGGSD